MAAPKQDFKNDFPNEEQESTYSQMLDKLHCNCPAGAQIRPSSLPSATIDLGDIIADHARILSAFASAYGVITVILKMIACIIDVLCCLVSPFCVIFAIIRLFGTCLPDFFLIFPQFAIPAIIICVIKIIISIFEYITTVIIPIILDIIENIQDLINAFVSDNEDAIGAVAFKLAALIKELYNILGILAVLNALWTMIQALLAAGIALPCGGSGGSCPECGDDDDICPSVLQQTSFSGTDGQFTILYGINGFSYEILFYSASHKNDLIQMRNFFPRGLDYSEVKDADEVPYVMNISNTDGSTSQFILTSVDSGGYTSLYQIPAEYITDGYLANTDINNVAFTDPLEARLNTKTETFNFSLSSNRYVTLQDTRGPSESQANGGSWRIQSIYDGYNILLKRDEGTWSFGAPTEHIRWKLEPSAPIYTSSLDFEIEINHEELIRHGLIGVGCHPAVRATKQGLINRFPDMQTLTLPDLPDFNGLVNNINNCISKVAPIDVDSQYILDNYQTIANEVVNLESCVTGFLTSFKTEAEDYAKLMYPIIFDPETSADGFDDDGYYFDATPKTQIIGQNSIVKLVPYDRNGTKLGTTLPPNIINIQFNTTLGNLSSVETEMSNGNPTGKYTSNITSLTPGIATITASVGGRDVSYFDGANLVKKEVEVEFVTAEEARRRSSAVSGEASTEPLGKGGN